MIVVMARLAGFVLRHKRLVVLFWMVITIAGGAAAGQASGALSQRFDLPGRESTEVNTEISERYGNGGFAMPYLVTISLPEGESIDSPGVSAPLADMFSVLSTLLPDMRIVSFATSGDRGFVSEDGRTTFALVYPPYTTDITSQRDAIEAAIDPGAIPGATIRLSGSSEQSSGNDEGEGSTGVLIETLVGAAGAFVVLLWVFGSALAVLPLVVALVSIFTCFLLVWGLTGITEVSFLIQFLIALIGLGVAIDYSLLVVTRWREERANGLENTDAVHRAIATAGEAVIFSGTTVAISLLALIALPVPFLRSVGFGGMLIPLVSGAVSITLLPVILATLGPRLDRHRLRGGSESSVLWGRWAEIVVHHRGKMALAGLALLVVLILPALSIELASPASVQFAEDDPAITSLTEAGIAPGTVTPFEALVGGIDPATVAESLAAIEGVAFAVAPEGDGWSHGDTSIVLVVPEEDASGSAGRATLEDVRNAAQSLPGNVRVGGAPAQDADFIDAVYGSFIPILVVILSVTFLLLVRAFRSLLLPLKAVLLNCLSVAAAYGVLVLVWQEGYGSELIWGIEGTGAIPSWLPLMVFSFLFGLSMDYEVFILARMREEYDRSGSTATAVVRGMSYTARLVTTAAIILFLAFVSLAAVPETDVKILATGLAAGIIIDATIVRALLVPATVALMDHWNWWLPSWLNRFVPGHRHPATTT